MIESASANHSFNRFELKYIVHVELQEKMTKTLAEYLVPDAYGNTSAKYSLSSLYYDSEDFAFLRAKVDGLRFRRKVRIRIYKDFCDDLNAIAHLEIKQRVGKTVQKRRTPIRLGDAYSVARGTIPENFSNINIQDVTVDARAKGLKENEISGLVEEVIILARNLALRPKCVTHYLRTAWVGVGREKGVRVTFDNKVACRPPDRLLGAGSPQYIVLPPDYSVLEIKVDEAIPLWLTNLVARFNLSLRRMSKYVEGVRVLEEHLKVLPKDSGLTHDLGTYFPFE